MGKFLEALGEELSLFVRQTAWLQAVPRAEEKRSLAEGGRRPNKKSRLEEFRDAGLFAPLPENPAPWLTDVLMEIGPTEAAGMDRDEISWRSLGEWQAQMGVTLQPWELRLLRQLSRIYLAESRAAIEPKCPSPFAIETRQRRRAIVSDQIDRMFDALERAELSRRRSKQS